MTKDLDWLWSRTALPPGLVRLSATNLRYRQAEPGASPSHPRLRSARNRRAKTHAMTDAAPSASRSEVLVIYPTSRAAGWQDFIRARYARPQASTASKTPSSG